MDRVIHCGSEQLGLEGQRALQTDVDIFSLSLSFVLKFIK